MSARITRAIVLVALLLVIALGVPLAVVVQRFYDHRAVIVLQRRAAEATAEISLPLNRRDLAEAAAENDSPGRFSVYDDHGRRLFGDGPARGDATVIAALAGQPSTEHGDNDLVVATPISKRQGEGVVGAMRVSERADVVAGQARRAWALMLVVVAGALAVAVGVARALARRLAEPVERLAHRAEALGQGDFTSRVAPSDIAELDQVGRALDDAGRQLAELLARERAFSADVSHQLRTPLAGLRLQLDRAEEAADPSPHIADARNEVDRLVGTLEHLLALSRDAHPVAERLRVDDVAAAAAERWQPRFEAAARSLTVAIHHDLPVVRGTAISIGQVLDVLLDNSLTHGEGDADLVVRRAIGGLVVEVGNEGPPIGVDHSAAIFERRKGDGDGIGLGLARTITEADGGRLLLVSNDPPRFHVVLTADVDTANPAQTLH